MFALVKFHSLTWFCPFCLTRSAHCTIQVIQAVPHPPNQAKPLCHTMPYILTTPACQWLYLYHAFCFPPPSLLYTFLPPLPTRTYATIFLHAANLLFSATTCV